MLSASEIRASAEHLASLQRPSGMIPWFEGGHCDPWNHVESAMALDVAHLSNAALRAYEWLADIQRADGSWHNYYLADGDGDATVSEPKLDTNVCAYVATGVLHHVLCLPTGALQVDRARHLWPMVTRALNWVLHQRRDDGLALWAVEVDRRPWDYALLTGTSSIQHALRCGAMLGELVDDPQPQWRAAADVMARAVASNPSAFEPKERWAMDWYYPVLTGTLQGHEAKQRLVDGWTTFVMDDLGVRCVSDEPWITASETAEASLSFAAIGDVSTATDLLRWTSRHRCSDGSYWTGIVHPEEILFPDREHTSYTAAAVILAADSISAASPASGIFRFDCDVNLVA